MKHRVAIVPCSSYSTGEVMQALRQGLDLLGGVEQFLGDGKRLLVKPNLFAAVKPESALSTHPAMIGAMISLLNECGAQVLVGDNPVFGFSRLTYRRTGMLSALSGKNARAVSLKDTAPRAHACGRVIDRLLVSRLLDDVSAVISLPKLKAHNLMGMSGAVKNNYGLVHGGGIRKRLHLRFPVPDDFARMLLDLDELIAPTLYVVDAIVASDGHGPRFGKPRHVGAIVLGTSAVAVDFLLADLIGIPPEKVVTLRVAMQEAAWRQPAEAIETVGASVTDLRCVDFNHPPGGGGIVSVLPAPLQRWLIRRSQKLIERRHG